MELRTGEQFLEPRGFNRYILKAQHTDGFSKKDALFGLDLYHPERKIGPTQDQWNRR